MEMYHCSVERKEDALQHALDNDGVRVGCGASTLAFDRIYGWVHERQEGNIIARWVPTIDYATMRAIRWRRLERR
jgi:hypothetical protein